MKSHAEKHITTYGCYSYQRKDTKRSIYEKIWESFLVLYSEVHISVTLLAS